MLIINPLPATLIVKLHETCEHFINEHNDRESCDSMTSLPCHVSSSASPDNGEFPCPSIIPHKTSKTCFIMIKRQFVWVKDSSG